MKASNNRIEEFSNIHLNGIYKKIDIKPLIKDKEKFKDKIENNDKDKPTLYGKICEGQVVKKVKVLNILLFFASIAEIIFIIVFKLCKLFPQGVPQ
jgi:hypothetical protein